MVRMSLPILALMVAANASAASETPARPNVVVILADDMGWSDLGCYGSEIETPHLDALAAHGVRFTQFYNTGRCCPTRASLLTGLYSHQAGVGHMAADDALPAYRGFLHDRCLTIAEAVRPFGYATLMAGKWHVGSAPGRWPLDRGFDRYWGTPSGGGVYFKDTLKVRRNIFFVDDATVVEPPDDMYVTDTFTTRALGFVEQAVRNGKPFFLYLAHIAPHFPLQAKPEDIAKYRGRYDAGWDRVREQRFQRQKQLGLFTEDVKLSPRDPKARSWNDVPADEQRQLARRMEIYAAQVDCIDQNVGRLVDKLKQLKQIDNTIILFLSDNGCSAEGGPGGFERGLPGAPIGTALSYGSLGLEWANVSNTPFRKFKMDTFEGGISTPLIAHWPQGIKSTGRLVDQPGHVIDLMPTILELTGATYPKEADGKDLVPLHGRSLKPFLTGEPAELGDRSLFWEHQGNKAVRNGDWKAVAAHGKAWKLYNLAADRMEGADRAKAQPEVLQELTAQWRAWAEECGVRDWGEIQKLRKERSNTRQ